MQITLFQIPDDQTNKVALAELQRLQKTVVELVVCPVSMKQFFITPFIKAEPGGYFYGIDSIRTFVSQNL